jgi:molybdopterin molybdotransferase/putative molybdopterin biosynthesis protein
MPHAAAAPAPTPQDAYARWLDACARAGWPGALATERVPVAEGLGRVTAAQVQARWPVPRSACAAMDGIAMAAASVAALADAPGPGRLEAASFTWVDTGDPVPAGLDTVVERERVELGADGSATITGPVPPGLHVRAEGEDFPAGRLLIPAGHRLRPVDLAAAAAAGYAELELSRQPVVAIIPTGDEVRPLGAALRRGEVTDSNSLMLAARATESGARSLVSGVQPDRPDVIAAAVTGAARTADLVLVIAGSSAGRRDHTAAVLARVGGLAVRGVAVRPGHPVLLGHAAVSRPQATRDQADRGPSLADQDRARPTDRQGPGRTSQEGAGRTDPQGAGRAGAIVPVIGVPGYPLAAAVIFELFAAPLIAAVQGGPPPARAVQWAQLACDWTSSADVEDWVPVTLAPPPGGPDAGPALVATPGRGGAGAISRFMRADAWWRIPAGQAKFVRGTHIAVHPIPGAPRTP